MKSYQYDSLKFATEGLTGFGCTVVQDDANLPSFMVLINKRTNAQLFTGGSEKTHSAFIVDDVEYNRFLISKFINCIVNGRAYSWPGMDPAVNINYDSANAACNAKGNGWHMMSIPERAVINHLIYKNGFIPRGNTSQGKNHSYTYEVGEESYADAGRTVVRTATGSGPATWFHDGQRTGVSDWVGNVWKWATGLRIVNGEIQIFVGNLAARQVANSANSTYWKAILPSGSLVNPGTSGTLKISSSLTIGTDSSAGANPTKAFGNITAASSNITIPEILRELHLFPVSDVTTHQGTVYASTSGERLPFVSGSYNDTSDAGPSALHLGNLRSNASSRIGFFSAFMELESVI